MARWQARESGTTRDGNGRVRAEADFPPCVAGRQPRSRTPPIHRAYVHEKADLKVGLYEFQSLRVSDAKGRLKAAPTFLRHGQRLLHEHDRRLPEGDLLAGGFEYRHLAVIPARRQALQRDAELEGNRL